MLKWWQLAEWSHTQSWEWPLGQTLGRRAGKNGPRVPCHLLPSLSWSSSSPAFVCVCACVCACVCVCVRASTSLICLHTVTTCMKPDIHIPLHVCKDGQTSFGEGGGGDDVPTSQSCSNDPVCVEIWTNLIKHTWLMFKLCTKKHPSNLKWLSKPYLHTFEVLKKRSSMELVHVYFACKSYI